MDWDKLGAALIKQGLPLLAGAIMPGGGIAANLLMAGLGTDTTAPDQLAGLVARADQTTIGQLKATEQRNAARLEELIIEQETARMREINRTMRTEARADDAWVRRWRPTLGYIFALEMGLLFAGLFWVVIWRPDAATQIITAAGHLGWIISVQAAVLGVSVVQRSNDKKLAAGQPTGLANDLANIVNAVKGGAR